MRAIHFILFICFVAWNSPFGASTANAAKPTAWENSRVHGLPTPPAPYRVEPYYPKLKFSTPKCVLEIPGTDRLLVAHGSKLVSMPKKNHSDVAEPFLVGDLQKIEGVGVDPNTVAAHPDFARNRFIFVAMGHGADGWHHRVMRYSLTGGSNPTVDPKSGKLILRWPAGGHGGGCLDFGRDGYLYISTGDGSGPTPPDQRDTGQDVTDLLGAVLRLDVNVEDDEVGYRIPPDNPFVHHPTARPEIWSYGLRNPWKFGIDKQTGDVFVADNGWETWELIHKLHRGSNCGWPIMEGRAKLRTEVAIGPTTITPPIKDHPHSEANSVIGGPVYRGHAMPELHGHFIYGDYITGTIWAIDNNNYKDIGQTHAHRTLTDTELRIVAFTEGSDGEIFVLDFDSTGQLYQLVPSDVKDTSAEFPRKLSDTGIFADTEQLQPSPGVHAYQIKAEPWMDGATARRWIALPNAPPIDLASYSGTKEFPDGTVFVKHLSLAVNSAEGEAERPIETQLLHYEGGVWNPHTYLWDSSATDATLVAPQGEEMELRTGIGDESIRTWRAGSTNECRLCHNASSDFVLGFNARQLDRDSQVSDFVDGGLVAAKPTHDGNALVNPYDEAASLDDRARSYLHMNCGICHNRGGPATISFFAHRDYNFADLRITKRPSVGNFGIDDAQLIKPGLPYQSVILYRLAKLGYGRMPYVGSRVVDSRGISLMSDWIRSLDDSQVSTPSTEFADVDLSHEPESTEEAIALMVRLHHPNTNRKTATEVSRTLQNSRGDIRGLFENFIPERERRNTLGANPDPQSILALTGEPDRGRLIFLSDNARCKSCHDESDASKSLGPTIGNIRKQIERRSDMLSHVLRPSERVDEKMAAWTVIMSDGRSYVGVIRNQDEQEIELMLADKRVVSLQKSSIEELNRSSRSIMPEGILSDLTAQEAADLLAFLMRAN